MCSFVRVSICVRVRLCARLCVCSCLCGCVNVYMCIRMCVSVSVCLCACPFACLHVRVCICFCVCVWRPALIKNWFHFIRSWFLFQIFCQTWMTVRFSDLFRVWIKMKKKTEKEKKQHWLFNSKYNRDKTDEKKRFLHFNPIYLKTKKTYHDRLYAIRNISRTLKIYKIAVIKRAYVLYVRLKIQWMREKASYRMCIIYSVCVHWSLYLYLITINLLF